MKLLIWLFHLLKLAVFCWVLATLTEQVLQLAGQMDVLWFCLGLEAFILGLSPVGDWLFRPLFLPNSRP